jgi:hypothetical protein
LVYLWGNAKCQRIIKKKRHIRAATVNGEKRKHPFAIAAINPPPFAGNADAGLPFVRCVCMKTSGGCLVMVSPGSARIAGAKMDWETNNSF